MKIGLEVTRANKPSKTGTEWYAWHLLEQFKKIESDHKIIIYYNNQLADPLDKAPANFIYKKITWPFFKFWTQIRLSLELLINPVDVFWASNAVPLLQRGKLVVTIHDLGFFVKPKLYHPLERIYQKISHWLAIKKADKIIAISEQTKQDIITYFPKAKNKIKVIYNGWDNDRFKPIDDLAKQSIREKYNLPANFLLYIGRLETKKNVHNLIKGYKLSKKNWPLVLAGRPGNYGYQQIKQLSKNEDKIIFTGYIPQVDYQQLLAASAGFVFPSAYEGFGIPILEAMGCRVPVACSDIMVLHEVAGDNALFFQPNNPVDIAEKINNLFDDKQLREKLISGGEQRASQFSWKKCAGQTWNYIID